MTPVYNLIREVKDAIQVFGLRAAMAVYSTILSLADLRYFMRAAYL